MSLVSFSFMRRGKQRLDCEGVQRNVDIKQHAQCGTSIVVVKSYGFISLTSRKRRGILCWMMTDNEKMTSAC